MPSSLRFQLRVPRQPGAHHAWCGAPCTVHLVFSFRLFVCCALRTFNCLPSSIWASAYHSAPREATVAATFFFFFLLYCKTRSLSEILSTLELRHVTFHSWGKFQKLGLGLTSRTDQCLNVWYCRACATQCVTIRGVECILPSHVALKLGAHLHHKSIWGGDYSLW